MLLPRRRAARRRRRRSPAGVAGPAAVGLSARAGRRGAVARIEPAQVPALEDGMQGDEDAVLEDADLAGMVLHLDDAPAGGVRNAVEVAGDGHHAVAADAPLDGERGAVGDGGQRDQVRALLGERLVDDAAGSGVGARVGQGGAPAVELAVEVVEVAEAPGEEEVLANVAEGPLDLALGLGAVRSAGARHGAVVGEQVDERGVVGHRAVRLLAEYGGLHAVVEDPGGDAAHGLEGGDVAAQHGLQVLAGAEPAPQPAAVAEDHGE